jgi:hypothetical protein
MISFETKRKPRECFVEFLISTQKTTAHKTTRTQTFSIFIIFQLVASAVALFAIQAKLQKPTNANSNNLKAALTNADKILFY